ncbi:hypothetical protein CVS40_7996 [Lucilia cuprina]|nr:hypothetical protein CVS40_7996 [Lucilia cuprina]
MLYNNNLLYIKDNPNNTHCALIKVRYILRDILYWHIYLESGEMLDFMQKDLRHICPLSFLLKILEQLIDLDLTSNIDIHLSNP